MFNFFRKKDATDSRLFYNTDIHCHIVPGVDDGVKIATEGADLIERQAQWGIKRILITPHITQDTFENTPQTLEAPFAELKAEIERRGTDVEIDYSAEHRIDPYFLELVEQGNIKPLPKNYLLVENSFVMEPWNLEQIIFDLSLKGYRPILAHPERYQYYHNHRDRYKQLHQAGLMFQVNLLSLAGMNKNVKQVAEWLIENDLVDFLGSDMHRMEHVEIIDKYLKTKDYRKHAASLEGRIFNDRI